MSSLRDNKMGVIVVVTSEGHRISNYYYMIALRRVPDTYVLSISISSLCFDHGSLEAGGLTVVFRGKPRV